MGEGFALFTLSTTLAGKMKNGQKETSILSSCKQPIIRKEIPEEKAGIGGEKEEGSINEAKNLTGLRRKKEEKKRKRRKLLQNTDMRTNNRGIETGEVT